MNYFQRPSLNEGKTILNDETDNLYAVKTLEAVIKTIEPNIIIFLSKKSFKNYNTNKTFEYNNIYHVAHPCSAWWNRNNGKIGYAKFEHIIENFINEDKHIIDN